jgi:hypothetical protein
VCTVIIRKVSYSSFPVIITSKLKTVSILDHVTSRGESLKCILNIMIRCCCIGHFTKSLAAFSGVECVIGVLLKTNTKLLATQGYLLCELIALVEVLGNVRFGEMMKGILGWPSVKTKLRAYLKSTRNIVCSESARMIDHDYIEKLDHLDEMVETSQLWSSA